LQFATGLMQTDDSTPAMLNYPVTGKVTQWARREVSSIQFGPDTGCMPDWAVCRGWSQDASIDAICAHSRFSQRFVGLP